MDELVAGSTYRLTLDTPDDQYPAGSTYLAEVRRHPSDRLPLLTLRSTDGTIERVDARRLVLTFPGTATAGWLGGEVRLDLWRVDLPDPAIWTPTIAVPVRRTITRRPGSGA